MCLDILTVKRTLKKDKKVWKVIQLYRGKEYPGMQFDSLFNHVFTMPNFPYLKQLKRKSVSQKRNITTNIGVINYNSGFHCFINKKDAIFIFSTKDEYSKLRVLDYIIPAGTEVQYGRQYCDKKIIVTPVLINPRKTNVS